MQGPAHLALSWFVGEACGLSQRRERRIVGLAGLAPDFDAFAYIGAYIFFGFDLDRAYREVWIVVHHYYTHGIGFAMLTGVVAYFVVLGGGQTPVRHSHALKIAGLSMLVSLTHVFCDLVAAGPRFPVFPWWPFSDMAWSTSWSWELKDWPNQVITITALASVLVYARLAGRTPLECLNYRLDTWVVAVVNRRPDSHETGDRELPKVLGMHRRTLTRVIIYLTLVAIVALIVIPVSSEIF